MALDNREKKQIVVDSTSGRIIDILPASADTSRYRSRQAYSIFSMDVTLIDRLNRNNKEIQGFDPRATIKIPAQRSASDGSCGDDGWYYKAFVGCGNFSHDERVEIDKARAFRRSYINPNTNAVSRPYYKTPRRVFGPGFFDIRTEGKWNGETRSCAEESIYFDGSGGQIVVPSRGSSALDNWLISGWFFFSQASNGKGLIVGKLDADTTGPESGTSGPSGGFSGGSGDSFMLTHEGNRIKFHWADAADTTDGELVNQVVITKVDVFGAVTGPTSGDFIASRQWHHLAVAYNASAGGSTITAYVNGIRTVNQSTDGGGIKQNSSPISFGSVYDPRGTTDHFWKWAGYMDEVVIGCTTGTSLNAGTTAEILNTENQKGSHLGNTLGLGDETWRPGYAYYLQSRGTSGCSLFDVQSGNNPGLNNREFYEGTVTIWDNINKRLFLRNEGSCGGHDYPTIEGGFITGMSCGAHYAVQSTGGASGSGGKGGLDIIDVTTYQEVIRNQLSSDTVDLGYLRLYGQTHNPGPTGSADNSFCTLFFGNGSCGGFSGTTNNFGPIGETHTGSTGGGSFSFVPNPRAMAVLGELVTTINAGTSAGSCGSYAIENAEGESVHFSNTEVIRLWGDLTEFKRLNNETEKSSKDKVTSISALTDGKTILDARVTSLANGTTLVIAKGTYVSLTSAQPEGTGYGFATP